MNIGIMTSYVVGGLMLLSILALNLQVFHTTSTATMDATTKNSLDLASDLLTNDFQKVGNYFGPDHEVFVTIHDDVFSFRSGVYEDPSGNWRPNNTRITWNGNSSEPVLNSENPNDFYLKRIAQRIGSGGSVLETNTTKIPVTYFKVEYYNSEDNLVPSSASNIEKGLIRYIKVKIVCESPAPLKINPDAPDFYSPIIWQKTFYPENLQRVQ